MRNVTEHTITDIVLQRYSHCSTPRLHTIMNSLIKHLHGFVKEVELTEPEWFAAIDFLTRTGKLCDEKRQEFMLVSDILGVTILVDAINHRKPTGATPSTVLGPFHIEQGTPMLEKGAHLASGLPGEACYIEGVVRGLDGKPIAGALVDVWQPDAEGNYESQVGSEAPYLRAKFLTDQDGTYGFRSVVPLGYSIPMDGTGGELARNANIPHMRPSHIHFIITADGFEPLTTHLFRDGDQYLDTDVVFGCKQELVATFKPSTPGSMPNGDKVDEPFYTVRYDFILSPAKQIAQMA
jgi:hydroxyquinol 1,2-dioxygenase